MAWGQRDNERILDKYAFYSYKPGFDSDTPPEGSWLAPMWIGSHRRRLAAYVENIQKITGTSRWSLLAPDAETLALRNEQHEHGEAHLIWKSIVSALLGERLEIGAPDEDAPPDVYMDWAKKWSKKTFAERKLRGAEGHAVGQGDGVLVLGWDELTGRASMRVEPPEFYFPVLEDFTHEFPLIVHLAWELEPDDLHPAKRKVRRITYELVKLEDDNGTIRQIQYPWNAGASEFTCLWSDGVWELGEKVSVEDLERGQATWNLTPSGVPIDRVDLKIDFIPVVHIPNTISEGEHFGDSSLAPVQQLLDEIASANTDLAKGAAIAGFPPLASEGGAFSEVAGVIPSYGPGTVFSGKLTSVDTSAGLKVLMEYVTFLLKELNTNVRVPEVLLGRVDPSGAPSGVAIRLMFTQMKMMIDEMRLIRAEKYPLIFKFAARFEMANGTLAATTEWPEITFIPGQFIPTDLGGIITAVTTAFAAKVISLETAITMLIDAGMPIESVEDEIKAIQQRDFAGAAQVGLALGSDEAAAEHLGRPVPARTTTEVLPDDSQVE